MIPKVKWPIDDDYDPQQAAKTFGKALEDLRRTTGQSRTEVCRRTGGTLRYSTFAAMEAGSRVPSAKTLPLLARGLGVQATDLQALWNALRTPDSAPRVREMWERLQEQARGDRERREEAASAIEEKLREFVETTFETGSGVEAAARAAMTAYITNIATAGAAVPEAPLPDDTIAMAGAAVPRPRDHHPPVPEPDYWQVRGVADWQPTEREQIVLDIWNDKPNDRPRTQMLGEVFQGIRESEGWSVEEVAGRLGLRPDQVVSVEAGSYIPDTDLVKDMILSLRREVQDTWHGIMLEGADGQPYLIEMDGPNGYFYPGKPTLNADDRQHIVWLMERLAFGNESALDDTERTKIGAIVELALLAPHARDKIYDRYSVSIW